MHEPAARILEHWGEFYLLVGTAAAALVALLFVATSIGAGILTRHADGPTRTYMSPIAFHFTSALFVSAVALVPSHTRLTPGRSRRAERRFRRRLCGVRDAPAIH
jgi:hypothetical protein